MLIIPQSVKLLSYTQQPEELLELAGRTCYKSLDRITPDSASKFVKMICKNNHESVLEHASASFLFTTDRGITHELVRHRIASFSQESTRYVNYYKKGQIRVIEPLGLSDEQKPAWLGGVLAAERAYNLMIKNGCRPDQARDVLPTCLATDIVVSANFREWRHIIKLRTSKAAHPKIRELIGMARNYLVKIAPSVFENTLPID